MVKEEFGDKKRLKFIRSKNPFEGLPDFKEAPYLRLKDKKITYPIQYSLFNDQKQDGGFGLRQKQGRYFELLSHGIYGGAIRSLIQGETKDNGDTISTEPDITDRKKEILREIKSVRTGGGLNLSAEQVAKYVLLQTKDYFKNPPRIRYEIFRHNLKDLQNEFKKKGVEDLVSTLNNSIKFSISLPFSLIFQLHAKDNEYCYEHDGSTYMECVRINSSGLNTLLAYPEKFIENVGLKPDRFKIEKKRFPSTATMNGEKINTFPMLFIYDKEYSKFIQELPKTIDSNKKLSEKLHRNTQGLLGKLDSLPFDSDLESVFGPIPEGPCPF